MNIRHKRPAVIDDDIPELDMSQSSFMKPEVVEVEFPSTSSALEVDGDGSVDNVHELSDNELPGDDRDSLDDLSDYAEGVALTNRKFFPAEMAAIDALESIIDEHSPNYEALVNNEGPGETSNPAEIPTPRLKVLEPVATVFPLAQQPSMSSLPEGFSRRVDGLYVVIDADKADGEIDEQFLCSPLRVIDLFRERDGSGWGRRIVITNLEGQETTFTVLNETLESKGRGVLAQLVGLGLRYGKVKKARETVLDLLTTWNPDKLMHSTNRQGWADNACEAFVLGGGRLIGDPDVVSVDGDFSAVAAEIRAHGTLEDWKANLAALCVGNTLMITTVSLALVGPLLELLGRDGGGLHLRGRSSRGKTTLQRSAASVWGTPKLVQSWRTTDNALEATAAAANSMLLVLDELGEVNGADLNKAAYMLANGVGKARLGGFSIHRPTRKWKLALLSSGEIGINEKIAESGRRVQAGQEVRLIDVVADAQLHGAFDELHGCADGDAFARLVAGRSGAYYGTAGPQFVQWLLENKETLKGSVEKVSKVFKHLVEKRYSPAKDGVTTRTLNWFALVASAGHLATLAGITGWPRNSVVTAVANTFGEWLDARTPDNLVTATSAVDRVRAYLAANADHFVTIAKSGPTEASTVGWQDKNIFFIPSATWKLIHNGIDTTVAARELDSAGLLVGGDDGNRMRKTPVSIKGRPRAYAVKKLIILGTAEGLEAA